MTTGEITVAIIRTDALQAEIIIASSAQCLQSPNSVTDGYETKSNLGRPRYYLTDTAKLNNCTEITHSIKIYLEGCGEGHTDLFGLIQSISWSVKSLLLL